MYNDYFLMALRIYLHYKPVQIYIAQTVRGNILVIIVYTVLL